MTRLSRTETPTRCAGFSAPNGTALFHPKLSKIIGGHKPQFSNEFAGPTTFGRAFRHWSTLEEESACGYLVYTKRKPEEGKTLSTYTAELLVDGLTCKHCVASVEEEVGEVEGVSTVDVELNSGGTSKVTVVSAAPLDEDAVRDAVTEAGFVLKDLTVL